MKKYSIYETRNCRGYLQRFINLNKEIVDTLQIKKGDTLYFIYQDDELLIKKQITRDLDFILNLKRKEILDVIFIRNKILIKKSKVIGDMQIGKRYHKLTIPSYICDKLHITSENSFTYDLLEDCVRINIEV